MTHVSETIRAGNFKDALLCLRTADPRSAAFWRRGHFDAEDHSSAWINSTGEYETEFCHSIVRSALRYVRLVVHQHVNAQGRIQW